MKGHRRTAYALATLACAVMLAWSVAPSHAGSHSGGGAGHGGGSSQGRAGWHGGSWHGHDHWDGGFRTRLFVDVPWWPYGYAYPYAYPYPMYSPPVVVESSPPEYVEPEPRSPQYWYYCQNPQGYYPYVTECPGGWVPVAPQPSQ